MICSRRERLSVCAGDRFSHRRKHEEGEKDRQTGRQTDGRSEGGGVWGGCADEVTVTRPAIPCYPRTNREWPVTMHPLCDELMLWTDLFPITPPSLCLLSLFPSISRPLYPRSLSFLLYILADSFSVHSLLRSITFPPFHLTAKDSLCHLTLSFLQAAISTPSQYTSFR